LGALGPGGASEAADINPAGQIVGFTFSTEAQDFHAVH
jgi:hypothetical protein